MLELLSSHKLWRESCLLFTIQYLSKVHLGDTMTALYCHNNMLTILLSHNNTKLLFTNETYALSALSGVC